jgi:excisionase family DNA binding protein
MEGKESNSSQGKCEKLMRAADVAKILSISAKTVNKLVRDGKLGCVQVTAKERRFSEDHLSEYIASRTLCARVDTIRVGQVSSVIKKGGEKHCRAKSFEAQVAGSLAEELKGLCR